MLCDHLDLSPLCQGLHADLILHYSLFMIRPLSNLLKKANEAGSGPSFPLLRKSDKSCTQKPRVV